MAKNITAAEFEALRPITADLVIITRDGEYGYETITDHDGNDIAFATYRRGEVISYTMVEA